jgi:hypothetical protein
MTAHKPRTKKHDRTTKTKDHAKDQVINHAQAHQEIRIRSFSSFKHPH